MSDDNARLKAFEARLASLRRNVESGLGERSARIEGHIRELATATAAAREGLRLEAHKLRGVAGSFGHVALGELAGALEQVALDAPSATVASVAQRLVDAVHKVGVARAAGEGGQSDGVQSAAAKLSARAHVLVIDDDEETRKLLDITMRQLGGYDATLASSGTEALSCLTQRAFDLVLCDAMMPDMNGLTFCERARAVVTLHALPPIVILSAATAEELGWSVTAEHAPYAWWRKPFRPKALVDDVRALLAARGSR